MPRNGSTDRCRATYARLQEAMHVLEGTLSFRFGLRGNTIGWDYQRIIPHVGVIRRVEDADVRGKSREDQSVHSEVGEQDIE
jgi:hypothetical protein